MGVNTISKQISKSNGMVGRSERTKNFCTDIKCSICENINFKVERIEPEIILLICENCGQIHKITPEIFSHKMLYLKFCHSDAPK